MWMTWGATSGLIEILMPPPNGEPANVLPSQV
jgi:hypothetical protein